MDEKFLEVGFYNSTIAQVSGKGEKISHEEDGCIDTRDDHGRMVLGRMGENIPEGGV